ncbi:MAG TPA: DUF308 domain-containing protein [Anaerolineales bacterium]|nr:DUF308 domain-containing protein [Anaerolineales bacterium]
MTTAASTRIATPWWLVLLEGIAAVIIGLLLISSPAMTTAVIVQVLGIYWFIAGIFQIVSIFLDSTAWGWKLFAGIVGILAGLYIINHPLLSTLLVPATVVFLLGLGGIVIGVINLVRAFQGAGWGTGILGVLSIILGLVLLGNSFFATIGLPLTLGILAIAGGIVAIIQAFRLR